MTAIQDTLDRVRQRGTKPLSSGRGVGFVKFQEPDDYVSGTLRDVWQIEDKEGARDVITLEVIEINADVFNKGTQIGVDSGDLVCVGMNPSQLRGRAKFMIEGDDYLIHFKGIAPTKSGQNMHLYAVWPLNGDVGEEAA